MNTTIFLIVLFSTTFVGLMIYLVISEHIESKREEEKRRKEDEEFERKVKDPEYRKMMEMELDRELENYNDNNIYYPTSNSSVHHNHISDSFFDITSPSCPYGMWYNF